MEHSLSLAATQLRPFAAPDAPAVADLFVSAMRHGDGRGGAALAEYLVATLLTGPFADPESPSRVAIDASGAIVGFAGSITQTLSLNGAPRRIAIGTTLMVRDHHNDPMTGARLLRALVSGPQDATISETASEESLPMWEKLGGETLPLASLEWIRVLRPAAFGLAGLARRVGPLAMLAPLTRPFDAWALRRKPTQTWTSLPEGYKARGGLRCVPVDETQFVARARTALAAEPMPPSYSDAELVHVITEAQQKTSRGPAHLRVIETATGKPIGVAMYHAHRGGIARLHTLLAPAAHRDAALDAVFAELVETGAAAVMGRSEPALFEMLSRRRAVFLRASGTVIHTRDTALRDAFRRGDFPLGGLFGERWLRLIGDDILWR